MLNLHLLPCINLRLFDGDGAGAAPAGAGATGETNGNPAAAGQGRPGDLSKVIYGKSPDTPAAGEKANSGAAAAEDTLEARQQEFDELVNGKYKDIYTQKTQEMIDRRFAKAKTAEAQNEKLRALADTLSQAYGITDDDGDYSKLTEAINNDDNIWSIAADEAGMSTAQYREFMRYVSSRAARRRKHGSRRRRASAPSSPTSTCGQSWQIPTSSQRSARRA